MRGVAVVEIDGLTKDYPRRNLPALRALDGVSLRIAKGDIFALLGPNGAGKTTLIGCVAGLVRATSGSARVCGHDVVRGYREARRAVGLVPQEINFDPFLTVEESLRYQAGYFGVRLSTKRIDEILGALGLAEKRKDNTRMLSGGMKRRLLIAKALAHDPQVLFLDEPTAGVDPVSRRDFWAEIHRLAAGGTTVLVTTHYMDEAERCHRLAFIFQGHVLDEGRPDEIVARRNLRAAEIEVAPGTADDAAARLRARPEIEGVEPYGHVLRVITRGADPIALAADVVGPLVRSQPARVSVEDAFVSMVKEAA
jgi:ABC-2 type transport system ATP-binding protein